MSVAFVIKAIFVKLSNAVLGILHQSSDQEEICVQQKHSLIRDNLNSRDNVTMSLC